MPLPPFARLYLGVPKNADAPIEEFFQRSKEFLCLPASSLPSPPNIPGMTHYMRGDWGSVDLVGARVAQLKAAMEIDVDPAEIQNGGAPLTHVAMVDSVAEDTPILVREPGSKFIDYVEAQETVPKSVRSGAASIKQYDHCRYEVLTHKGWQIPNAVMRHEVRKPLLTVVDSEGGRVRVTEDHSLMSSGVEIAGRDLKMGELNGSPGTILDHEVGIHGPQLPTVLPELAEAWGFFAAEGTANTYNSMYSWRITNTNRALLEKYQRVFGIVHTRPLSMSISVADDSGRDQNPIYYIDATKPKDLSILYRQLFYTYSGKKKIPREVLNGTREIMEAFLRGYEAGDGHVVRVSEDGREVQAFCTNSYTLAAGLTYLYAAVGRKIGCHPVRRDKTHIVGCFETLGDFKKRSGVKDIYRDESFDGTVYDFNTDAGTFVGGVGNIVLHNSDMTFGPDSILRLMSHDLDVVGGLCFSRHPPYMPVIARVQPPELGLGPKAIGWLYDYPENRVIEVDRTGAAFLLLKMGVLRTLVKKYGSPAAVWAHDPDETEDMAFCRRLQECGFKIHVDTGCKIGHIGKVIVDDAFARINGKRLQAWASPHERMPIAGSEKPVASIVIPTYNQKPKYLKAAVYSALSQTAPVEVIVVDDGSTVPVVQSDGQYELVGRPTAALLGCPHPAEPALKMPPGVRVVHHETNQGIAAALNTGIKAMRTDWFAWLSSDDYFTPDKIESQITELRQRGALAGCHNYEILGDDQNPFTSMPILLAQFPDRVSAQRELLKQCCINGSTVMLHKSVFEKVGVFDSSYGYSQDYELWNRIAQHFDWNVTQKSLGSKRNDGNLTKTLLAEGGPRLAEWQACDARIKTQYALKTCPHCGK